MSFTEHNNNIHAISEIQKSCWAGDWRFGSSMACPSVLFVTTSPPFMTHFTLEIATPVPMERQSGVKPPHSKRERYPH